MQRKEYRAKAHIGIGGMDCACCAPKPVNEKKKALRVAKRRLRREFEMEIEDGLNEYEEDK